MLGSDEEDQVIQALYLGAGSKVRTTYQAGGVSSEWASVREVMALKTKVIAFLQNVPEEATIQEVIDTLLDDDKIRAYGEVK